MITLPPRFSSLCHISFNTWKIHETEWLSGESDGKLKKGPGVFVSNQIALNIKFKWQSQSICMYLQAFCLLFSPVFAWGLECNTPIFCLLGRVRSLSTSLWSLTHLTALHLNDNYLSRIPPDIAKLHNLVYLDLSSNKLRSLPAELGNMVSLRWGSVNVIRYIKF